MTSFVFPTLQGLTFDVTRTPIWHTEKQMALSGKRSTIAYQQYPLIHFELVFSILRDDVAPSDVKALVGLFNACQGSYDTFLFTDPDFNIVNVGYMGSGDGATTTFQTVVAYANSGAPYGFEIIQNFNTFPSFQTSRYGSLIEYMYLGPRTQYCLWSADYSQAAWVKTNVTAVASTAVAPDGTFAFKLNDSSSSNVAHSIAQFFPSTTAAGIYTLSVFVWTGGTEAGFVSLQVSDNAGGIAHAEFNTVTGAVVSSGISGAVMTGIVPSTAAVDGAWNRLSIAFTSSGAASSFSAFIQPRQVAGTSTYAGTSGTQCAVLWGAQFENTAAFPYYGPAGAWPSMYLPTTTATRIVTDVSSVGATGIVTYTTAPAVNQALYWTGSFYYRCAFDNDQLDLIKFMNKWWSIKKLPFTSVKL